MRIEKTLISGLMLLALSVAGGCGRADDATTKTVDDSSKTVAASKVPTLGAGEGHVRLVEEDLDRKTKTRRLVWVIEFGPGVQIYTWGIRGSGKTGAVLSTSTNGADVQAVEIVYVEREVKGSELLRNVSSMGGEDAKSALLDAVPEFEAMSSRGYSIRVRQVEVGQPPKERVGTMTTGNTVPGSTVSNASKFTMFDDHLRQANTLKRGQSVMLADSIFVSNERMNSAGAWRWTSPHNRVQKGPATVRVNGETVKLTDYDSPAWQVFFRIDGD